MSEPMFPMLSGAAVPWSVLAPHEARALKNHGQTLKRLAERGGLGGGEAWCIVNNIDLQRGAAWKEAEQKWQEYAERINLPFGELASLREQLASANARIAELEGRLALECASVGRLSQRTWELEQKTDTLTQRALKAEEDSAMLDWLEKAPKTRISYGNGERRGVNKLAVDRFVSLMGDDYKPKTLRAAIRNAMTGGGE